MKLNYKRIINIIIIISIIVLIVVVIPKNKVKRVDNYLITYFNNENSNQIYEINNIINNKNKDLITKKVDESMDDIISSFNKSYVSLDELDTNYNYLKVKISNLLDNLDVLSHKEEELQKLKELYDSKKNYLDGIDLLNQEKYEEAYTKLSNVIEIDSYYEEASNKFNEFYNIELNKFIDELDKLNTIKEDTSFEDKINIYNDMLTYLEKIKEDDKYNIAKSDEYNNRLESINNSIYEIYVNKAKELASNKDYEKAIELLSNKEFNDDKKEDINKIIDEYKNMLPKSLLKIETTYNDNIAKENEDSIKFTKTKEKTSSITYYLNGEYKYLNTTLNITSSVKNKKNNYGSIKIYTDDKLIYDSKDLTTKFKKKSLNIDLTDIKNLKIEYTISNNKSINKNDIVVATLSNPILNKY